MNENTMQAGSSPSDQENGGTPESPPESIDVNTEASSAPEDAPKESESSPEKEVAEAITAALDPESENTEQSKEPAAVKETEPQTESTKPPEETKPPTLEELYEEPEGLKPASKERFRNLVEANKQTTAQLEEAGNAVREIQNTVNASGMSPEQFGTMIEYGRLVHSSDKIDMKAAYEMVKAESRKLALELGITEDGVDLLDDFPDLKEKRESLEITEDAALELAKYRRQNVESTRVAEQDQIANDQQVASQATQTQALDEVRQFMSTKKQTDIDFDHKESLLMEKVADIQSQFEPQYWPKVVKQLYETIGSGASESRDARKRNSSRPLSPAASTPSGENHSTALDAIKAVLS